MAVTLRLARYGVRKNAFYRFVATDQANKRNGEVVELLGTYNPMVEPTVLNLKEDRIKYWLSVGAQVTSSARDLIRKKFPGVIEAREEHQKKKTQAARRARKERTKARGGAAPKKAKAAKKK